MQCECAIPVAKLWRVNADLHSTEPWRRNQEFETYVFGKYTEEQAIDVASRFYVNRIDQTSSYYLMNAWAEEV